MDRRRALLWLLALALLLGGSFALLVTLFDTRGKKPLTFCFMLPLMIAPQITALAWIDLFGPNSTLLGALGLAPAPGTARRSATISQPRRRHCHGGIPAGRMSPR